MEIIYPDSFLNFIEDTDNDEFSYNYEDNLYFDDERSEINEDESYRAPFIPGLPNFSPYKSPMYNKKPPVGPPPSYMPSKNNKNVKFIDIDVNPNTILHPIGPSHHKYANPNSVKFCLYKYAYIWQKNGRGYWSFLINADRWSITGWRWVNRNWNYFKLDLRAIAAFECY